MENSTKGNHNLGGMQHDIIYRHADKYYNTSLEDTTPTVVDFFKFDKDFWGVAVKMALVMVVWMTLSSALCLSLVWAMKLNAAILPALQMLFVIVGGSLVGVILVTAGYLLFMLSIKLLRGKKCT